MMEHTGSGDEDVLFVGWLVGWLAVSPAGSVCTVVVCTFANRKYNQKRKDAD